MTSKKAALGKSMNCFIVFATSFFSVSRSEYSKPSDLAHITKSFWRSVLSLPENLAP